MTSLAELVAERREQLGMSLRGAAEASGGLVSKTHLAAIETGETTAVSDRMLRGIALALELPLGRVREAAGVRPALRPFSCPERADRLNARERRLVISLIDTLLAAREEPR